MTEQLKQATLEYELKRLEYNEKQAKRKSTIRLIIASFMGGIVLYMLAKLFNTEVPPGNREVIYLLVGNATGAFFGTLLSFYFGDSEGKADFPKEERHEEHKE